MSARKPVAARRAPWFRPLVPTRWAAVLLLAALPLAACHREVQAPAYPSPEDPPLEETDLWPYFEGSSGGEAEGDEAWEEGEDEGEVWQDEEDWGLGDDDGSSTSGE